MDEKRLAIESSSATPPQGADGNWKQLCWLPCLLTLELPLAQFTIRDLLRLEPGTVVQTRYSRGAEIPLRANNQLIGWAEFEALGNHIAVRVTELG